MEERTALQITHEFVVHFSHLLKMNERISAAELAVRIKQAYSTEADLRTMKAYGWLLDNPARAEKTPFGVKTFNVHIFELRRWTGTMKFSDGGPYVEYNSTTASSVERIGRREDGLWWLGWLAGGKWNYQVLALNERLPHRRKELKIYVRLLIAMLVTQGMDLNYETESL